MIKKTTIYYFTKILIDVLIYGGIITCMLVPYTISQFGEKSFIHSIAIPLNVVLIVSGLVTVYALWQIRAIFKSIFNSTPFTAANVNALRRISVSSFIIAIVYIYKCFFWLTLATMLIVVIFFVTGLFCIVLKDVFKQAVFYKEENDLTI